MLPRLERFLLGPKFACIEAESRADKIVFHLTLLQKKKEKAETLLLKNNLSTVSVLLKHIDQKTPVVLIVTGKGIISRRVNAAADTNEDALIKTILPNAASIDMLMSGHAVNEQTLLVSVTRKETVQNVVERLKGLSVVSVLIGPSVALTLLDLLNGVDEEWNCGNHSFGFQNGLVQEVAYISGGEQKAVKLGRDSIPGVNVVSFAGALQGLTYTSSLPGEVSGFTERLSAVTGRRNFIRMKRYGAAVKSSVLFTLLILLLNYFLFTYYRELKSGLESDPRINSESLLRFHELQEKVDANKQFFEASGWTGSVSFAWMADQLAAGLPEDILLTRMNIAPAETFNREDTLGFTPQRIMVSGTCSESASLNSWLKKLQQTEWISSAAITTYSDAGAQGKFELELAFR